MPPIALKSSSLRFLHPYDLSNIIYKTLAYVIGLLLCVKFNKCLTGSKNHLLLVTRKAISIDLLISI